MLFAQKPAMASEFFTDDSLLILAKERVPRDNWVAMR